MKECVQTTFADLFEHIILLNTKKEDTTVLLVIPSSDNTNHILSGHSINHEYASSLWFNAFVNPNDTSVAFTLRPRNVSR